MPIKDLCVLSRIYTPGVGAPCRKVYKNPSLSFDYTCRGNSIALISDGSQVYGLGNIGGLAELPKLEAKSVVYKTFANIDAMNISAAEAISNLVGNELKPEYILPGAMDFMVPPAVAEAVGRTAIDTGAARYKIDPERIARHTREFIYDERLSLI